MKKLNENKILNIIDILQVQKIENSYAIEKGSKRLKKMKKIANSTKFFS